MSTAAEHLRVAVLVDRFPLVSETFVLRHVTGLLDRGHDVTVFSKRRPPDGAPVHPAFDEHALGRRTVHVDELTPPASGYWEMPLLPLHGRTWLPGDAHGEPNLVRALRCSPVVLGQALRRPRLTLSTLSTARYGYEARSLSALHRMAVLQRHRGAFDVVHVHFGPTANSFRFAGRLLRAPLVVTFHGYDFSSYPREHGPDVYADLFRESSAVTVNSQYAADRLAELGCPRGQVRVVHCGIDLAAFPYRTRVLEAGSPVRLLTTARLVPKKGLHLAVRAVARLLAQGVDVDYEIIGEGPLRRDLEALIGSVGAGGRVRLVGAQPAGAVRAALDRAHVFVLPSLTAPDGDQEGTPVSLMEAQACGLPVVATRHSGIPEVVLDGSSGVLADEADEDDLVRALHEVVAAAERWPEMGRAGREHMQRTQDGDEVLRQTEELYRSLQPVRAWRSRPATAAPRQADGL